MNLDREGLAELSRLLDQAMDLPPEQWEPWLAERVDGGLQRQVALKLPRHAWGRGLAARMARERDIGAMLVHPNLARLYDAGIDSLGRPYLALEYIDGTPIDAWCEAKQLDVPARLRLFLQVLRAVAYAHGRLVVHRDLKPSNILVTPDGQAHLLDFGIAKLLDDAAADTGLTAGLGRVMTPHYAAPEQLEGGRITVQTDVYSLGVLLFELLAGSLPYAGRRGSLGAIEEAILGGDAPLASSRASHRERARLLRGDIDAIIVKAMQRAPGQRYAGAEAMAQDIERHLEGRTISARPYSVPQRVQRILRRHWKEAAAGSVLLLVLTVGGTLMLLQSQRAQRAAERERVVKDFVADLFRSFNSEQAAGAEPRRLPTQLLERSAELYGIVGGVFAEMGAQPLALAYAQRQIRTLEAMQAPGGQLVLPLLMQAEAQLDQGRFEQTTQTLAQVDALARQLPGALQRELAWAAALRAEVLVRSNRPDEAFAGYRQAVQRALDAEGPASITAAAIRLLGARWYRAIGDVERTRQLFEPALATLRAARGVHGIRAAVESARQWQPLYAMQARVAFSAARVGIEQNLAELRAYGDLVPQSLTATVQMWLARALVSWGDVEGAAAIADHFGPLALESAGNPLERLYLLGALALIALERGQHDAAARMIEQGRQARIAAGRGRQALAVRDYHGLALAALMGGHPERAQAVLKEMPEFEPARGAGNSLRQLAVHSLQIRARALLDLGDADGALALVPRVTDDPLERNLVDGWFGSAAIRGEALCLKGQAQDGLALLERNLDQLDGDHHPHAPKLAWLRAIAGQCALQAGRRRLAEDHAAQAEAAFTAQPGVSPYYKAALARLQGALGRNATGRFHGRVQ